jgi:hypothetical protein
MFFIPNLIRKNLRCFQTRKPTCRELVSNNGTKNTKTNEVKLNLLVLGTSLIPYFELDLFLNKTF